MNFKNFKCNHCDSTFSTIPGSPGKQPAPLQCPECESFDIVQWGPTPADKTDEVEATLEARGKLYGNVVYQAAMLDALINTLESGLNFSDLTNVERQSMRMIALKLSRILTGGRGQMDSWQDIAGYATLAMRHCR